MVVFTCQYCSASLKKKVVESHRFQCRRDYHLTCVDCLQDFFGNEYVKHVSCLSEEQKYGGKNFTPTTAAGKQIAWYGAAQALLKTNISPAIKGLIEHAAENPNIPRNKKKFMNYFNNQGAFKHNKYIGSAFDAIEAEFKRFESKNANGKSPQKQSESGEKSESAKHNGEDASSKKKDKKRKTISETQEDNAEDGAAVSDKVNHFETKSKKKKNKMLNGGDDQNRDTNNVNNDCADDRKNKKKKKKSLSLDVDQDVNVTCSDSDRKKKNKKYSKEVSCTDDQDNGLSAEMNGDSFEDKAADAGEPAVDEELLKLSKKERKKLLKQRKYKAEIESIENYQRDEDAPLDNETDKKKKSKKNKSTEETAREAKTSISEPDGKKLKLQDDNIAEEELEVEVPVEKPKKFRWDKMILQVLRSASDQEMSLKRLSRKVCGEYQLIYGDKESYDDILLTFNKKVVKTRGVVVFKDKAKIASG